ncbi:hypothetical protein L6255_02915 [Candidatus Parcubacteria bacterium]|nr:hypothetical protein [Candidatus Parcubacteria bacterium]
MIPFSISSLKSFTNLDGATNPMQSPCFNVLGFTVVVILEVYSMVVVCAKSGIVIISGVSIK